MKARKKLTDELVKNIKSELKNVYNNSEVDSLNVNERNIPNSWGYIKKTDDDNYIASSFSGRSKYWVEGRYLFFKGTRGAFNGYVSDALSIILDVVDDDDFDINNGWEVIDSLVPAACGTREGALVVANNFWNDVYVTNYICSYKLPAEAQEKIKSMNIIDYNDETQQNADLVYYFTEVEDPSKWYLVFGNTIL